MKYIYLVSAFDGEPYSDDSWALAAFNDKSSAESFIDNHGTGPFDEGSGDYPYGWFVSKFIRRVKFYE